MKTTPLLLLKFLSCLLCLAVLPLASPLAVSALSLEVPDPELTRLLEISTKLVELNEQLRNELDNSKRNSTELSRMLETSKNELELLKAELEPLRLNSTALRTTALNSEPELNALRSALNKAGTSLTNLETSYSSYRTETESQLTRVKNQNRLLRYTALALGTTTLSGWLAFALTAAR
jgi:chromosome segregation ATPase